jgi:hypothetical protein
LQRPYAMALPVLNEFCQCDGNWWTQKRLRKELEYVRKTSKRQSDAAKSRWQKEKPKSHGNAARHTSGNAPTPIPIKESPIVPLPSEPEFEEFWKVYPRKVGKGQARIAWRRAITSTSPKQIVEAAKLFAKSCVAEGKEEKFTPHATTWLNGERWLDKVEEKKPVPACHGGIEFEDYKPWSIGDY